MASDTIDLLIGRLVSSFENEVSLVGGARDEVYKMKDELEAMKSFLKDAESGGTQSEIEKMWVAQVKDIADEAEDIINEFTYWMNRQQSSNKFKRIVHVPKHLWVRHRIAKELQKINTRIREILERNQRYGFPRSEGTTLLSSGSSARNVAESSFFMKDDELVGMIDEKQKLLGWLQNALPQRTVVSVVGMGGSGKTTIAANIFKSEVVQQHFEYCAWVTVSQTYVIDDLLRMILKEFYKAAKKEIPSSLNNLSYRELVEILVHHLQSKRYLLIMDDVWEIVDLWRDVSAAIRDGNNGSRVMLTTRIEDIASFSFGVESHVLHVKPLMESEAWDLFCKKAFSSRPEKHCPTELRGIAEYLVRRCKGLPLGIVALGSLMSTKLLDQSEWRKVYNSLNWELRNNPRLDVVKSILLLSFNNLPYRLKNCFLYCCVFPEDYVMQHKRLIRLWMAEGFIEQVKGLTLEETAESYLTELICRSMLQVVERLPNGMTKTCKMHDLLRELALSISEGEKFCTTFTDQEATEEGRVRRLSLQATIGQLKLPEDLSKVRSFLVFVPDMITPSLATLPSGFKMLHVLDLKNLPIKELPDELAYCFNLKYLNLKGTELKELPKSIRKLRSLETLDIRHTEIKKLPRWIAELKSLRNLLVYSYSRDQSCLEFDYLLGACVPSDICELKNLQYLYFIEVGSDAFMKRLRYMTQLRELGLTKVREAYEKDLCISIEGMKLLRFLVVKTIDENEFLRMDALSSAPPFLERLELCGKLEKIPKWFNSLQSVTNLKLHSCRLRSDFLPYLQALPNLASLFLLNACSRRVLNFESGFKKLSYLQLSFFPQLNYIVIEKGVMPCVQQIEIAECMKLMMLPSGIEYLSNLQELNLVDIPGDLIERIQGEGSVDRHKVKHISKIHYFDGINWMPVL
ncbi:hypothetical protein UlMin_037743 [Ulmus minor]